MDILRLCLVLKVCPNCGRHATVLVMDGETAVQKIPVLAQDEARRLNDALVQSGGTNQDEFLAAVASSTLTESVHGLGLVALLLLLAGDAGSPAHGQSFSPGGSELLTGRLELRQCESCETHGHVYLHVNGRPPRYLGQVYTKVEACEHLERLVMRGLPEQLEFERVVREAEWLAGPMPSALLTAPGTYHPAGKPTVVPMDAQRVATLRAGDPDFDRRQIHLLRELSPGLL